MRFDDTHPAGRIHRANDDLYPYPMHRAKHWPHRLAECPWCQFEAEFRPAPPAFAPAPATATETGGARALAFLVLYVAILATALPGLYLSWAWFTNLGPVTATHLAGPALLTVAGWLIYRITRLGRN